MESPFDNTAHLNTRLQKLEDELFAPDYHWWGDFGDFLINGGKPTQASFAACPTLVDWAVKEKPKERIFPLVFIGVIELNRQKENACDLPSQLQEQYLQALKAAKTLVLETLGQGLTQYDQAALLFVLTVILGEYEVAYMLIERVDSARCPNCQTLVNVNQEYQEFLKKT